MIICLGQQYSWEQYLYLNSFESAILSTVNQVPSHISESFVESDPEHVDLRFLLPSRVFSFQEGSCWEIRRSWQARHYSSYGHYLQDVDNVLLWALSDTRHCSRLRGTVQTSSNSSWKQPQSQTGTGAGSPCNDFEEFRTGAYRKSRMFPLLLLKLLKRCGLVDSRWVTLDCTIQEASQVIFIFDDSWTLLPWSNRARYNCLPRVFRPGSLRDWIWSVEVCAFTRGEFTEESSPQ